MLSILLEFILFTLTSPQVTVRSESRFAYFVSTFTDDALCALFIVTGLLVHHIAEVADTTPIRFPFRPVPGERERKERKGEKCAFFDFAERGANYKVSSAEMHVKRFKRAPEVSFALSFPSHPTILVSIAPFAQPRRRVNLFYGAGSRVLTSSARPPTRLGCILLRFETSHGRDSSLFAYLPYLPTYLSTLQPAATLTRPVAESAKESSLKYPLPLAALLTASTPRPRLFH